MVKYSAWLEENIEFRTLNIRLKSYYNCSKRDLGFSITVSVIEHLSTYIYTPAHLSPLGRNIASLSISRGNFRFYISTLLIDRSNRITVSIFARKCDPNRPNKEICASSHYPPLPSLAALYPRCRSIIHAGWSQNYTDSRINFRRIRNEDLPFRWRWSHEFLRK